MLALLLPTVLISLFLYRLGSMVDVEGEGKPWQGESLIATALTGGLLVIIMEILSAFQLINQLWITLIWGAIAILVLIRGVQTGYFKRGLRKLWNGFSSWQTRYYVFVIILGLICILLFTVAVISSTNNVDSLLYHMPRVMQWAQNHSLEHFPVQKQLQNKNPYWAEVAILGIYILVVIRRSTEWCQDSTRWCRGWIRGSSFSRIRRVCNHLHALFRADELSWYPSKARFWTCAAFHGTVKH